MEISDSYEEYLNYEREWRNEILVQEFLQREK